MTDQFTFIQNLPAEVKEIAPGTILSRSFLKADRVQATLFGFAPGQELTEHTSGYPAIMHFLQGEADITLGSEKMTAQAGSWAYMQPGVPHSLTAKSDVIMLLLLMVD